MPMQPVTLRRWEAAGVLLLLTLSFVLAVALVSRESRKRADANRDLIHEIQTQRAEITYLNCLDQNERHNHTVMQLDSILRARKLALRKQITESRSLAEQTALRSQIDSLDDARSTTVSLIDALQPSQQCEQLVLDRFGYVPDVPTQNP